MEQVARILNEESAQNNKCNDRLSAVEIENLNVYERDQIIRSIRSETRPEMISSLGSSIVSLYTRALGSSLNLVNVMGHKIVINNEDDLKTDFKKTPVYL